MSKKILVAWTSSDDARRPTSHIEVMDSAGAIREADDGEVIEVKVSDLRRELEIAASGLRVGRCDLPPSYKEVELWFATKYI